MSDKATAHPPRWVTFAPRHRRTTASIWRRLPVELGGLLYACEVDDPRSREGWPLERDQPLVLLMRHGLWPGATYVAAGVDCGLFPLVAAHFTGPTGRVVVVEANQQSYRVLAHNIERNHLTTVTAVAAAASDMTGPITANVDSRGASSRSAEEARSPYVDVTARAALLDAILDDAQIKSVSLLHVDMGGAEAPALAGLTRRLTAHRVDRVLLQLHPQPLREEAASASELLENLRRCGFAVWRIDPPLSPATQRGLDGAADLLKPVPPGGGEGFSSAVWLVREGLDTFGPVRREVRRL